MRYLMILKAAQPSTEPPPALMDAIMKLGADATAAGALLDTAGLAPPSIAGRQSVTCRRPAQRDRRPVRRGERDNQLRAVRGALSKQEAVEWASRFLTLHRDMWPGWEGDAEILKVLRA